jgi:isopentenyldiphosphate isomerase
VSADEILDVVTADDEVVGQARRADVYARKHIHRCVFVLVRDAAGRIFVHRRTDTKLTYPGRYDVFVGGVVGTGETYDEAALREAEEELGVTGLPRPTFRFKFLYEDAQWGAWWSAVYEVEWDGPVHPQETEVAWYGWLAEGDLAAVEDLVPDGAEAWRRLRTGGS